ncbi:glycosyltransferase [Aestuariivita boseongensis]|uniref:glycosyltransferase n=1 Tax=Aestuariivita boseongensis TaxID=1470562 RepID=UPI0006819AD2|nr:glycosyltransferase [Aestuariivita boseongensis]
MILVTVGMQLPFDRLIQTVDDWARQHPDTEVIAQTGQLRSGQYKPRHMPHMPGFAPAEFDALCRRADLIIAHAGTGSLIAAHAACTPLLMMPRRARLGEHRNDHQIAMADSLKHRLGVHLVYEEADLHAEIDRLLENPVTPPQLHAFAEDNLITAIRQVIFDRP